MKLPIYLALKNLVNHKKLFFLLIGILIFSFVNLTFFDSIENGVRETTNSQLEKYVFADLKILPNSDEFFLTNSNEVISKIERLDEVVAVSQRLFIDGSVSDGENNFVVSITGIDPLKESLVTNYEKVVKKGNYLSSNGANALIGDEVVGNLDGRKSTMDYEVLDLDVGSTMEIYFTNGVKKDFKVQGVFDTLFWISDFKIFISIKEVREIYGFDDSVSSEILIKLKDGVDKKDVKEKLVNSGVNARIIDSAEELGLADTILESQKVTNVLANIIGIFSTFITVFIVIYINVNNKKRQLGIFKAIGIKESSIIKSYVYLSFFYSVFGVIFGVIALYGICYYLQLNPIKLPMGYFFPIPYFGDLFKAGLLIIFSSILSGYLASYSIIKTNIVEVIRGN